MMFHARVGARQRGRWVVGFATLIVFGAITQSVKAHHPEGEYVQSMVRPAVGFLEKPRSGRVEWGEHAIIALALYKSGKDPANSPHIQEAVNEIRAFLNSNPSPDSEQRVYAMAVGMILLCDINAKLFEPEITELLRLMLARQRPDGSWSYPGRSTGDVSQTQYAVLALWTAQKYQFRVDPNVGRKALTWVMTVQGQDGGWPYMGQYEGPLVRRDQARSTPALAAGGLGSVYMLADWLGYGKEQATGNERQSDGLPAAVTVVKEEEEGGTTVELVSVNEQALKNCKQQGNGYFRNFSPRANVWPFYYLYGYERYKSFQEKAQSINPEEPAWYNQGCEFLKQVQNGDGSWDGNGEEESNQIATAFALLFLLRGTKKSLGRAAYTDGTLRGGQGLRDDAEVALKNNRVVSIPVAKSLPELLGMLENPDTDQLEFFAESVEALDLTDPTMSKTQMRATMYNLVNHKNHAARLIVVKTLSKERLMENVPALIFALTDPRHEIAIEANEGLKFISRKLEGYSLTANPSDDEKKALKKRWVEWYLDLVPDGQLLD